MYYAIRHITRFRYSAPISQSVMEVRMHPRTEGQQRCPSFHLAVTPQASVMEYRDHLGNTVHHFDIPSQHRQIVLNTEALVEMHPARVLPNRLSAHTWSRIETNTPEAYDMLLPSQFAHSTPLLEALADELGAHRRGDPLGLLRELTEAIADTFAYVPESTRVDSPIDDALQDRKGVCQDFSHIMIALVRRLGIPCRYVSGYLFHRREDVDRSAQDATHAWVEALLPDLGWVGFDPTNSLMAGERHIRVAVGRDYADVPPTRGVFKGDARSELTVSVQVYPTTEPQPDEMVTTGWRPPDFDYHEQQQQQQQQ